MGVLGDRVDLHIHSIYSDGTEVPERLVWIAMRKGLKAISLTDHDTLDGIDEFLEAGRKSDFETIPGVELRVAREGKIEEAEILGYFLNQELFAAKRGILESVTEELKRARKERAIDIVRILQKDRICITMREVYEVAEPGTIERTHIAEVVLRNNADRFSSAKEIWIEYLGPGGKAYVKQRFEITLEQAICYIHDVGGIAIVAHPSISDANANEGQKLVKLAFGYGADGAEVNYPYGKNRPYNGISSEANRILNEKYVTLVEKYGKLKSAGSDFHGERKDIEMGEASGPYSFLSEMKIWSQFPKQF